MTAPTTSELIERLRSAHMPTPVDPNAVYRTRPVTLFQEAATRLADLERERDEALAKLAPKWRLDPGSIDELLERARQWGFYCDGTDVEETRELVADLSRSLQEARGVIERLASSASIDLLDPLGDDRMARIRLARAFLALPPQPHDQPAADDAPGMTKDQEIADLKRLLSLAKERLPSPKARGVDLDLDGGDWRNHPEAP